MTKPSSRESREHVELKERTAREVFAAGRVPSKREQELVRVRDRAKRLYEAHPTHPNETAYLLAEHRLEEYRRDRMGV